MTLMEICERCDRREHEWTVRTASLRVGEINRDVRLCEGCTLTVMSAVLSALRPTKLIEAQDEAAALRRERDNERTESPSDGLRGSKSDGTSNA